VAGALSPPAAVLCDMDGLLLDSERLAGRIFAESCRGLGWQPPAGFYESLVGTTHQRTRAALVAALGDARAEALIEHWEHAYGAHVSSRPVPHRPGARALLERLRACDLPVALVTSTRRPVAETKLRLAELYHYFELLVCADEAPRGKPHPEPYLKAAADLGLPASRCWVLEDSSHGARAGLAAGCMVLQVPDLLAPDPALDGPGYRVVPSLHDVLALLDPLVPA